MFGLGVGELAVVLLIMVVMFGGRKLPELGAGLGKGIKNFRDAYTRNEPIGIENNEP